MAITLKATCFKPHSSETFRQHFDVISDRPYPGDYLSGKKIIEVIPLIPTSQQNGGRVWEYEYMLVRTEHRHLVAGKIITEITDVYAAIRFDENELFNSWWPRGYAAL